MDFSKALTAIKAGKRLTREAWHTLYPGRYVHLVKDSPTSCYLAISGDGGKPLRPWRLTGEDVLAEDWEVVS